MCLMIDTSSKIRISKLYLKNLANHELVFTRKTRKSQWVMDFIYWRSKTAGRIMTVAAHHSWKFWRWFFESRSNFRLENIVSRAVRSNTLSRVIPLSMYTECNGRCYEGIKKRCWDATVAAVCWLRRGKGGEGSLCSVYSYLLIGWAPRWKERWWNIPCLYFFWMSWFELCNQL